MISKPGFFLKAGFLGRRQGRRFSRQGVCVSERQKPVFEEKDGF
jgi:hypothetical protein